MPKASRGGEGTGGSGVVGCLGSGNALDSAFTHGDFALEFLLDRVAHHGTGGSAGAGQNTDEGTGNAGPEDGRQNALQLMAGEERLPDGELGIAVLVVALFVIGLPLVD